MQTYVRIVFLSVQALHHGYCEIVCCMLRMYYENMLYKYQIGLETDWRILYDLRKNFKDAQECYERCETCVTMSGSYVAKLK